MAFFSPYTRNAYQNIHVGMCVSFPEPLFRPQLISLSCFSVAAELLSDLEGAFQEKIDAAYFDTSKYLLDVLNRNYLLLEHLQAMRRYLLLGQGDFIRHLMDLLKSAAHTLHLSVTRHIDLLLCMFKAKFKVLSYGILTILSQTRVGASCHHFVPTQPDWNLGDGSQSHKRPV